MNQAIKDKIRESLASVLPITMIVFVLCATVVPLRLDALLLFLVGAALLIVGMGVFTLGSDMAMSPMGERVGAQVTKRKRLSLLIVAGFIVGFVVTIAEPDLSVLASKMPSVGNWTLIITVALGVAISIALALYRIVKGWQLKWLLIAAYAIVAVLSIFVPSGFVPVSFDAGGVTTGAITVPFLLALGSGVSTVRYDKNSTNDSFGLVSLASVGPIIVTLILGLFLKPQANVFTAAEIPNIMDSADLFYEFVRRSGEYFKEVTMSLLPLVVLFAAFQVFLKTPGLGLKETFRIIMGVFYTFIGLVIFLTGINVGFMPAGTYLGEQIASMHYRFLLVPIGMLIGYFIVSTEPAVHTLVNQVEAMTEGAVKSASIRTSLGIGVSLSVGLAMLRVLTGIPLLYIALPGYAIALGLTFVSPKIFTAIAFDSGGVASGPMTAAFLLPFAMGACHAVGGNVATDAFGLVALVAMTPLITIQTLGVYYARKSTTKKASPVLVEDDIIECVMPREVMYTIESSSRNHIENIARMNDDSMNNNKNNNNINDDGMIDNNMNDDSVINNNAVDDSPNDGREPSGERELVE